MKRFLFYLMLFLAAGACGTPAAKNGKDTPAPAVAQNQPASDGTLRTKITLDESQQAFLSKSSDFSFRFIRKIDAAEEGDWFVSPMSLQFLLGMILNGAQGATAQEIAGVLGTRSEETGAFNDYGAALLAQLPERDPGTRLTMGNAIFLNQVAKLKPSYVQKMDSLYHATVENLDFLDGEGSLDRINGWCSEQTNGLIPSVIDKVDPAMMAYLLNAIYFKGVWVEPFKKDMTKDRPFHLATGAEKPVPMMSQLKKIAYGENELCRSVRLPYGNGAFAMTVFLPAEGRTLKEVTDALDAGRWDEIRKSQYREKVDLWLPRFESKYHVKLNDILSDMGMPRSFKNGKADFKAMSEQASHLDFVQQDAIIKVDEEGAEAAAVSSAGMMLTSAAPEPPKIVVFHADQPFLYLITESTTGAVLFAGKYTGQ